MENFGTNLIHELSLYYDKLISLLPKLALGICVFLIVFVLAVKVTSLMDRKLKRRLEDPLLGNFLTRIFKWSLITAGFLLFLNILGLHGIAGSLLAGAGVSAFIIGFAFKDIGENLLAGIMLAFSRPFRIGDTIEIGSVKGKVTSLTLRTTQLKTFDGKDVFVPNSSIVKSNLHNFTIDGFMRYSFVIGVDYGTDIEKARSIMLDVLRNSKGILTEPREPMVHIDALGSSAIELKAYYWIDTFDSETSVLEVKTKAIDQCLLSLAENKVNMPSEVIELKNYDDSHFRLSAIADSASGNTTS